MTQDSQADKIAYFITPLILNIHLKIHYAAGTIKSSEPTTHTQTIKKYISFSQLDSPDVNLIYRFGSYDYCYQNNFIEIFTTQIFSLNFNYDDVHYKKLCKNQGFAHKDNDFNECSNCGEINEQILLTDQGNYICKNCTQKMLKEAINQRLTYFVNESYVNVECRKNL